MKREREYTQQINNEHIKTYGQYFTQYPVAHFMCSWACSEANTMLDPAVGNSIFLQETKKLYPSCQLHGFEIDEKILSFFGNPANAAIRNEDYLLNDWDSTYDAIVCNPPYSRFQAVTNRQEIIDTIHEHTGIKYSRYTNLYILFLIKSLYQLSSNGKLAYIIPTEFLNSQYGTVIKEKLIKERLLRAIINFQNNSEMFFNATTTSCILLIDHSEKEQILFYNLLSFDELDSLRIDATDAQATAVSYDTVKASDKWRFFTNQEEHTEYRNLVDVAKFCKVSRGIATGANDFFCMSKSKMQKLQIPSDSVIECICHSADVKKAIFSTKDFKALADADKTVYLLDIKKGQEAGLEEYIAAGEQQGLHKKHLLSCRKPWYSMEQKAIAPIWVCSANRNGIKFVRNLANVSSLTTFHSIFVNEAYKDDINILFCYFLTPIAQTIIRANRKELGNGLEKFQPNDLKTAKMLDISLLSQEDYQKVSTIYNEMIVDFKLSHIEMLNELFSAYLTI